MRLATTLRRGLWPVATALATMLVLAVGPEAAQPAPRDQQYDVRARKAKRPAVRALRVNPSLKTVGRPPAGPRRERLSATPRIVGPAKDRGAHRHDAGPDRGKTAHRTTDRAKITSRNPQRRLDTKRNSPAVRADRFPRNRAVNAATPALRQVQRLNLHAAVLATRLRLPAHPFPGERNFTGVPPTGETRFVSTELVFQAGPNVTQQQIDDMARRHNCVAVATQRSTLTGGTLIRFRIAGTTDAADMVRAMEAEQLGVAQPNYLYETSEQAPAAPAQAADQYIVDKLKLAEVHKIATGKGVLIAIIDSQIDTKHPELANAIAGTFDAVGTPDKPHAHGTGMLGAIVERSRLMGIAPDAKALAIHAFSTGKQQSAQATTQSIIAGLDWALSKGARVINMSFAGPYDPMLQVALKAASERGAVLIAAVGNNGPTSPPLYPAADPHVIGVTATDQNDEPFSNANRGAYVAVAAPGVNILAPAPEGTYQLTTGTSVAAAHVSGVAALLIERHPNVDAATILDVLTASATKAGANGHDDRLGWGLIDPGAALAELDARIADSAVAATTPAPPPTRAAPAPARSVLPRPGLYAPK
jgi:hypothetical protein